MLKLLLVYFSVLLPVVFTGLIPVGLVPNTPKNIALIESGNHKQHVEELSGQFEGDIVLTHEQRDSITGVTRNGLVDLTARWPNNVVKYVITDQLNENEKQQVLTGLRTIESVSCIRFEERGPTDRDYVEVIGENTGCWSQVGRTGGKQNLNLQLNGCMYQRTIVHEFLHAIGFFHMQSSTDREDYVRIAWDHIEEGYAHNFNAYGTDEVTSFGLKYDVQSIMHYSAYSFTKDGYATLIPNDIDEINKMGYYDVMSDLDIQRLNIMYNC